MFQHYENDRTNAKCMFIEAANSFCPILMEMTCEETTLEFTQRMGEGSVLRVKELTGYVKKEVESRNRTADLILKKEPTSPASHMQYRDTTWEKTQRREMLIEHSHLLKSHLFSTVFTPA